MAGEYIKKVLGRTFVNLEGLQTVVTEIEVVLNDRPITYVTSETNEPEPLTPSHLLYGRRIVRLPHEIVEHDEIPDPTFGDDSEVRERAKRQSLLIQSFWKRWKHEYLTSLREFHKASGTNQQRVKEGEIVLIHDDAPRVNWRLAVIENLVRAKDGLIRAAEVRTSTGRTNRPISRLYPLEVSSSEKTDQTPKQTEESQSVQPEEPRRSRREAAKKGREQIARWTKELSSPPEDVENSL